MTAEELGKWYEENYAPMREVELLTDLIPKGKTLVYGQSGAGKTVSVIKNLNRYGIKPFLVDFDKNVRIRDIDFSYIDGSVFVNGLRGTGNINKNNNLVVELKDKIDNRLEEIYIEIANRQNPTLKKEMLESGISDEFVDRYTKTDEIIIDILKQIDNIENENKTRFLIKNETIIIDTCTNALLNFPSNEKYKSMERFNKFIDLLLQLGNNVILMAHSKRFLNTEVPDFDEVFVNHCDARLHLNVTMNKSKEAEYYLFVKKLRGYTGKTMIKNWER